MKVRLIKPGMSSRVANTKPPPVEIRMIDTVRSWVRDFQSTKADRTRADFKLISNSGKV
jgi:hypothetical protein